MIRLWKRPRGGVVALSMVIGAAGLSCGDDEGTSPSLEKKGDPEGGGEKAPGVDADLPSPGSS